MLPKLHIDAGLDSPLYRQIYEQIRRAVLEHRMARGEKLPPTRELAGSLGLNRTTIAAAYELLESDGLIRSHVGRGTFVDGPEPKLDWGELIAEPPSLATPPDATVSFSASKPPEDQFPLAEFRATVREVIDSAEAIQILQLGPASGYGPLRKFILSQMRERGVARAGDDVLITSGAQQAFDLMQRVLAARGETVAIEDPVYPGLRNAFLRGGARVLGAPMGDEGIDVASLERLLERDHPRLLVLTPNFQNPTGTTIPEDARKHILEIARRAGTILIENDLYGSLRYWGDEIPSIKQMDDAGDTIALGSFSKIAFPGLRVGWVIGPRRFIERLTEAKEASDLHSDQLSQAVLLKFAQSGRLAAHREKMIAAGALRLRECLDCCARFLPGGSVYTRPEGGMNVWVRLPEPLDAAELALRAARENVSYLPGKYFAVSKPHPHSLRLSFVGLAPHSIHYGMQILGTIFKSEMSRTRRARQSEPLPALV